MPLRTPAVHCDASALRCSKVRTGQEVAGVSHSMREAGRWLHAVHIQSEAKTSR